MAPVGLPQIFLQPPDLQPAPLPEPPPLPQIALQVHWNSSNVHLTQSIFNIPDIWEHAKGSCLYRICLCFSRAIKCVVDFFLSPFKRACARLIVPVSNHSSNHRRQCDREWTRRWSDNQANPLMATYAANTLQVSAPDGTLVKGAFYRHQLGVGQDVPTIVCFTGNSSLAKEEGWEWLLKKGVRSPTPFNVAVIDYRSTVSDLDQCVLDGDSVIQALHEGMGISEANIHMLGYSLGGGVSAKVRHLHADAGNYVNLRSFSSINEVIKQSNVVDLFTPQILRESCIGAWVKPIIAGIVSVLNWNIDTSEPLQAIGERALVVYHPEDPIIPGPASSAEWVETAQAVEMRVKAGVNPPQNHHLEPLNSYEDANGLSINKRIMNFILQTDHFQRRQPIIGV